MPRFQVDRNVGSLARRLRWLGYDAEVDPGLDDADLVEWACRDDRVLLTRDQGIMLRRPVAGGQVRALWIVSDRPMEQLAQVVGDLALDPARHAFSRCVRCNVPLETVSLEEAATAVPPFVSRTQRHFTRCPSCGRYFWRGTHWQRIHAQLLAFLGATD